MTGRDSCPVEIQPERRIMVVMTERKPTREGGMNLVRLCKEVLSMMKVRVGSNDLIEETSP